MIEIYFLHGTVLKHIGVETHGADAGTAAHGVETAGVKTWHTG